MAVAPPLHIIGWNSWGMLIVVIKGRRYEYDGVYEPLYKRIQALLQHKNYSAVFKILRRL